VTHADAWPFACDIDALYTVGIDRLANVAGAMALGLQSAIAVDMGTAITIDVLDAGVFRGGLIMPGLSLQAYALHAQTASLPLVDVRQPAGLVGRDTRAAMLAGITQMTFAGVAATARRLARGLPGGAAPILVTGGWAYRLRPFLRTARFEPHLLFLGLREQARRRR
jgi:type III pantothenate kinase